MAAAQAGHETVTFDMALTARRPSTI